MGVEIFKKSEISPPLAEYDVRIFQPMANIKVAESCQHTVKQHKKL